MPANIRYQCELDAYGIPHTNDSGDLHSLCPICRFGENYYQPIYSTSINAEGGFTFCDRCHMKLPWEEFVKMSFREGTPRLRLTTPFPQAPEAMPLSASFSGQRITKLWSAGEILRTDFGDEKWLIDRILPFGGMMALSGNPSEGKTWLAMYAAKCVALGLPVFGKFTCIQGAVLYIDEEMPLSRIKERLMFLGVPETAPIHYLSRADFKADDKQWIDEVRKVAKKIQAKLIVLDSLVRIHSREENDAGQMAQMFHGLQEFCKEGIAVLFTHHHRKTYGRYGGGNGAQDMRGSSDISAVIDSHFSVEKKEGEGLLILRQNKARYSEELAPFEVEVIKNENGPTDFIYKGRHDEKKRAAEEAAEKIPDFLGDSIKSRQEIVDGLKDKFGENAVGDGIKLALKMETIERVPKEELPEDLKAYPRRNYYRRATAESPDSA